MIGQPLTVTQMAVAVFLHCYQRNNDNMPTLVEVADAFGVTGNASHEHIQRLKKHGVLEGTERASAYRFARTSAGLEYRKQIIAEHLRQGGKA